MYRAFRVPIPQKRKGPEMDEATAELHHKYKRRRGNLPLIEDSYQCRRAHQESPFGAIGDGRPAPGQTRDSTGVPSKKDIDDETLDRLMAVMGEDILRLLYSGTDLDDQYDSNDSVSNELVLQKTPYAAAATPEVGHEPSSRAQVISILGDICESVDYAIDSGNFSTEGRIYNNDSPSVPIIDADTTAHVDLPESSPESSRIASERPRLYERPATFDQNSLSERPETDENVIEGLRDITPPILSRGFTESLEVSPSQSPTEDNTRQSPEEQDRTLSEENNELVLPPPAVPSPTVSEPSTDLIEPSNVLEYRPGLEFHPKGLSDGQPESARANALVNNPPACQLNSPEDDTIIHNEEDTEDDRRLCRMYSPAYVSAFCTDPERPFETLVLHPDPERVSGYFTFEPVVEVAKRLSLTEHESCGVLDCEDDKDREMRKCHTFNIIWLESISWAQIHHASTEAPEDFIDLILRDTAGLQYRVPFPAVRNQVEAACRPEIPVLDEPSPDSYTIPTKVIIHVQSKDSEMRSPGELEVVDFELKDKVWRGLMAFGMHGEIREWARNVFGKKEYSRDYPIGSEPINGCIERGGKGKGPETKLIRVVHNGVEAPTGPKADRGQTAAGPSRRGRGGYRGRGGRRGAH